LLSVSYAVVMLANRQLFSFLSFLRFDVWGLRKNPLPVA